MEHALTGFGPFTSPLIQKGGDLMTNAPDRLTDARADELPDKCPDDLYEVLGIPDPGFDPVALYEECEQRRRLAREGKIKLLTKDEFLSSLREAGLNV